MGYQKCITEIQEAAGGVLSEDDLENLLSEITLRARRNASRQVSDADKYKLAAKELSEEMQTAIATEKRNAIINLEKRVTRREHYRAAVAQTGDVALALESRINGVNTPIDSGRKSGEAIYKGLQRQSLGGLVVDLDKAGLTKAFQSDALLREWTTEFGELNKGDRGTPGISGSEQGLALAKILHKYQRASVDGLNREGAWIRDYFAYVTRTSHGPDQIRKAGKDAWVNDVMAHVDIDRTFGGDAREAAKALREMWVDFKDGTHLRFDDALEEVALPGMNMAKKASASRVLHWKSNDDWLAYIAKYGNGGPREIYLAGLDRAARTTALMQIYGTNPRAAFESDLDWARTEFRGDDNKIRNFDSKAKALDNRFSLLDGTANMPVNRMLANLTSGALAAQRWSKLGGASLSAIVDIPFKAAELRYQGVPFLERWSGGLTGYLRGRGSRERKEVADLLLSGLEARMGEIHLRYDVMDSRPGTIAKIDNLFFKLTGLTQMTVNQRSDFEVVLARHLGRQRNKEWKFLPVQTKRAFAMAGVDAERWELLRTVPGWSEVNGRAYLTPDVARRIDDGAVQSHLIKRGKLPGPLTPADFDTSFQAARDARLRAEERHANSAASVEEPDAYAPFREVARGLSNRAQKDFEVHGIVANPEMTLRALLDGKVSAADLAAGRPAPGGGAALTAPYLVLSDKGKSLAETGVKTVILNGPGERFGRRLSELYPGINFLTTAEAARVMEGGKMPVREAPATSPANVAAKVTAFKEDLATTLAAFYADRGTYAVLESGVREQAMLTQGTRPGTPEGTALRLIMQFKAFPTAVLTRAWGREIYGGQGRMGAVAGLVPLMVNATAFGYLAMILKDVVKGREPRVPDPDDIAGTASIIQAAFLQGGGAGIYGDYLFGQYNRHGHTALEAAAGPTLSTASDLIGVLAAFREGDDASAKALKLAVSNVPGANIWWAKTALDHLLLYQLQEMANPGSVRRSERTVERNNNQKFWLSPSESVR